MINRGLLGKIRRQVGHEDLVIFTGLEARRVILEGLPLHDQVELIGGFDPLREQVAVLAVKGAEQILRREVSATVHAELLTRLKSEL